MEDDDEEVVYSHEDGLAIKANVMSREHNRILVDLGSSVDILSKSTLNEMKIADLRLEPINALLKGFRGWKPMPIRVVELLITIEAKPFEKNDDVGLCGGGGEKP